MEFSEQITKKNKIVDCFTFYNEIELLTYRLNILNDVVDYFIIVESTHTHTGFEKILYFDKNLFEKFKEKIIYIVVDDFQYKQPNINYQNNEQWKNENYQRNCISKGLTQLNLNDNDLIIISDLDEIPDPRTLFKIKQNENDNKINDVHSLEMDLYYYNLNTRFIIKWYSAKIIPYKKYKETNILCNDIRCFYNSPNIIKNGGWHLSYFGDSNFIKNKILNTPHQEFNNDNFTDIKKVEERVKNFSDLYDREEYAIEKIKIQENNYLPVDFNIYLKKYFE